MDSFTPANQDQPQAVNSPPDGVKPEPAHVLFMDIVAYSKLPMSKQHGVVNRLQQMVQNLKMLQPSVAAGETIILFTGDGMALSFFGDPLLSLESAKAVAQAVQEQNDFKLRIGLHSGPVYRIRDINANQNVAGGGINIAQRVMDCGDAGHILMSKTYADYLVQLGDWNAQLRDLGECEVKHGLKLHLFNFYDGKVGNPAQPGKLTSAKPTPQRKRFGWKLVAVLASVFLIGVMIEINFSPVRSSLWRNGSRTTTVNANVPVTSARRLLSYSVIAQTYEGERPVGEPIEIYREIDQPIRLRNNQRMRFRFNTPAAGYLYLLNESPRPGADDVPIYNVLFPSSKDNNASASIAPGTLKIIPKIEDPSIGFYGSPGSDKVWLVWSVLPVEDLEALKTLNNPINQGRIKDQNQIQRIQQFLKKFSSVKHATEVDEANHRQNLLFEGDLLVYPIAFEHR